MAHPSSYRGEIDFADLARRDPDFGEIYKACGGRLDWKDAKTNKQLTITLLKLDFKLRGLELPDDRLNPPVPGRYSYISWVHDLLDTTSKDFTDEVDPWSERAVLGIDIGVGASCIFPLLGCARHPKWSFCGTDIDSKSFEYAQRNVALNHMEERIRLWKTKPGDPLLPLDKMEVEYADFTMCNPPFYAGKEEMQAAAEAKAGPPSAIFTGSENEVATEGGEAGFVLRMIEESKALGDRVQWYSSMLGKLESVGVVVAKLRKLGVTNFAIACLKPGSKTNRWAVAWSFGDLRPANGVARGDIPAIPIKELLPFPTEYTIPIAGKSIDAPKSKIDDTLGSLDLRWTWEEAHSTVLYSTGFGFARENVWSRAARRAKKRKLEAVQVKQADDEEPVALAFRIRVFKESVTVRWLRGADSVLFESFCGMLKTAVTSN